MSIDHEKPQLDRSGNINTIGIKKTLPPGLTSLASYGSLYVEIGDLKWLTYDGSNYMEDKIKNLYANIKFWGESPQSKGIYLKFKNGLKSKKETAVNSYKYVLNCPEPSFEKYVDDMGALVVDFYDVAAGQTIGTSKVIVKLFTKREKSAGDTSPLIELRGTFPVTLTGNDQIKIGEFNLSLTTSFGSQNTSKGAGVQNSNNNQINLEEENMEEQQTQNQRLHNQINRDDRIPSSLQNKTNGQYDLSQFDEPVQERPTRDKPKTAGSNSNFSKTANSNLANFGGRQEISMDETVTNHNELESILSRGEKLQKQMADAIDPSTRAWESIHGAHHVPKTYVPPFMKDEFEQMQESSPEKIQDKLYAMQIDADALNPPEADNKKRGTKGINYSSAQNLEELPIGEAERRQIKNMKFIRVRVKSLHVESDSLAQALNEDNFTLQINLPLPDVHKQQMSGQEVKFSNYETINSTEFAFNSLSLYNFRVDEATLQQYVGSVLNVAIKDHGVSGKLAMNKLIMANDFRLEASIELEQKVNHTRQVKLGGRKKAQEETETEILYGGRLEVEINLQSGDTEDEMKRNFQIKQQKIEETRATEEAQKQEALRKKMQFVMEQAPVFGQLYLHIDKLGENDNIGERSTQQKAAAAQEELGSTLNNRASGTEDAGKVVASDDLKRASASQVSAQKRNLFVQFKAFPNLETLKTQTVWQKDGESEFDYRSQFPVLMCPDTLTKMETFTLVLELWDQISPSVTEFLGLVKVPLAPICYSMKTTDDEVYSLNFLADQFCMYPMTVCDGFLPIYSPKLGQNIAHLKINLSIGSPVQVTRLICREQEEDKRKQKMVQEQLVRDAAYAKEQEMKAARKAKKEKKRLLEAEQKERADAKEKLETDQYQDMIGMNPGATKLTKAQAGGNMAWMRQSVNSQLSKKDYDDRGRSMLDCMRKLFEDARRVHIAELNGEEVFSEGVKNFDGTVQKDEVLYSLLNSDKLSLTRIEVSQIISLMLDINRDDAGRVDVDELHFSFKSYLKYYELIEQRIVDLLEKFKLSISKKFEIQDLMNELVAEIEARAVDSKMPLVQLREIIEDRHGIIIRDAIYDQFLMFFDLDRDQQVYITSLCEYVKNQSCRNINFFKVNTSVITNQISDYVKNSIETSEGCMATLEDEFKQEIWKNHQLEVQKKRGEEEMPLEAINVKTIPTDLLINEQVNAKLFQFKLKRLGIALSLWEVFTLFEHLNTKYAKMHFEPQRYHHVMFGTFYLYVKSEEYNRVTAAKPQVFSAGTSGNESAVGASLKAEKRSGSKQRSKSRDANAAHSRTGSRPYDSVPATANVGGSQLYDIQGSGYNNKSDREEESSEKGYWHKNEDSDTEDPRRPYKQLKHVFEIKVKELKNIPILNKFICQSANMAEVDTNQSKMAKSQANKYIQNVAVKYSFPLDEDEILESDYLQLNRDQLSSQGQYNYGVSMDTVHTYILSKEDNIKGVLEMCQSRGGMQNPVNPGLEFEDNKQTRREELFNMSIALFQDNREYIIGNAHLPIEDLVDMIGQYEGKNGTFDRRTRRSSLNRTLFLYGTNYSQRENCIIGKLQLDIEYSQEKLFLNKKEAREYEEQQREKMKINAKGEGIPQAPYSCFMHRETYINRKIPLNAKLSVLIDRVSHLKESIENIEHFSRIQHSAMGLDSQVDGGDELMRALTGNLATSTMVHNRADNQHLDRRRVLNHILKNGLNLIVRCSMFEEDQELVQKFQEMGEDQTGSYGKYQTRMLYNSLNPVFGEVFEMNLQMDTKIFEYLKNKRAVFEVRHYIIQSKKQKIEALRKSQAFESINSRIVDGESENTIVDDDVVEECDYIVLGHVRVPLLQLITKNNGVDGDFSVFDEFKQKMGALRLRITLNHHNSQRPLYSTSSKIPNQLQPSLTPANHKTTLIEKSITLNNQINLGTLSRTQQKHEKYILGLNFIELILKNRFHLVKHVASQTQRFYLKYRLFGQVFQTKFIGADQKDSLDSLNILLQKLKMQRFDISKSNFIEIDMTDSASVEQAFGKPLEIQLWHKIESTRTYEKPIKEEMLGQFFVELNELSKITNRRLKEQKADSNLPGKMQVYEGYFSLHDTNRDAIGSDRLGMRLYLFHKDEHNETLNEQDMNAIFNLYRPKIEERIAATLDVTGKGYGDKADLLQIIKDTVGDEYVAQKLIWFVNSSLEYKSVDKVYYSPLFGLPPPFFKYAHKFDQLEIICRFNEEFENLDSNDNGYIPCNILKNVLEGELNLKTKIVDDFINGIRDLDIENTNEFSSTKMVKEIQSLDVNLITNSLKTNHIDYIILLRKLSQFMEQNKTQNNIKTLTSNKILEQIQEVESAHEATISFEVENGMQLKNPVNQHESPNAYVYMKPTIQCKEASQFVQTNQVKSTSYPTWNFKSYNFTMPLNEFNLEFIENNKTLEFEVFHKSIGASDNLNVQESSHLIGVAFVPLKELVEGHGRTRLTGLFDVIAKDAVYQSVTSGISANAQTLGKIKVAINVDMNIKKYLQQKEDYKRDSQQSTFDPRFMASTAENLRKGGPAVSFGKTVKIDEDLNEEKLPYKWTNTIPENAEGKSFDSDAMQKLNNNVNVYRENLASATENQIEQLHQMNLNELESLTIKIKQQMENLNKSESQETSTAEPTGFGHQTFKTDQQRSHMTSQMKQPFRADEEEDLTRHAEPVASSLVDNKPQSPAFAQQNNNSEESKKEDEVKNVFHSTFDDLKGQNEIDDIKELQRIEKILTQKSPKK